MYMCGLEHTAGVVGITWLEAVSSRESVVDFIDL